MELKITTERANFGHSNIETDARFYLGGGFLMEKGFNHWLAAQVGILYKNRGWQELYEFTDKNGEVTSKETPKESYSYLSMPVLVKGSFKSFFFSFGPSLDMLLNVNSDFGFDTSGTRNLNASLYLATGYRVQFNELVFLDLEANYNGMLFSVYDDSCGGFTAHNYGLGFSLGYKL